METRANHVLIGAFTLVVVVAAALAVLWLGRLRLARQWDHYDVVFEEAVTGLTVGGAVQYNGIQVGEVRKLSLDLEDPRKVIARVRVAGGTPVKTDTKAKLTFTGLTFVAIIQLFEGTREAPMLAAKPGEPVPRILAEESAVQKFLASGEDMLAVAHDVLLRLQRALDRKNVDSFSATLQNVEKLTGQLASHDQDITAMIDDLRAASRALRRTLERSEKVMGSVDRLAVTSEGVMSGETRALLVSVARLADSATALIEQNRKALASFSNQDLAQVGPTLAEMSATARALRTLADDIERDPQSLLRGKKEKPRERDAR